MDTLTMSLPTAIVKSESDTKLHMSAPKYGVLIPNRIFVSGLTADTTENELFRAFTFAKIKSARIIFDRNGVSKGYGFVTFETQHDAQIAQTMGKSIFIKDREVSIAPAIKKSYIIKNTTGNFMAPNGPLNVPNYPLDYNSGGVSSNAVYQTVAVNGNVPPMSGQNPGMQMYYPQAMQYQPPLYYMAMDMPMYWPQHN